MFLAVRELKKEKTRFILVVLVIFLVSYLVFFLTSLAYGLATSYTKGIDAWKATGIALEADADQNISRSLLSKNQYESYFNPDTMELLGVSSGVANIQAKSTNVTFFGVDTGRRLMPYVKEGKSIKHNNEVIISSALKDGDLNINDYIKFKSSDQQYKIVGIAGDMTFQTQPVVYMSLNDWRTLAAEVSGMRGMKDDTTISGIVTFSSDNSNHSDSISWQSISDFSFSLPGYRPQVLTFSLMIGFLIFIAALVLSVFMYILTIQKKAIFGVLKAEGVGSAYIARSVIAESLILVLVGLLVGLICALVTGFMLSGKVPFAVNGLFFVCIAVLFAIGALLGSLVSVSYISRVDPVEVIR